MIYKKTMDLRWITTEVDLGNNCARFDTVLQQRRENIETGESKWEDIPFVTE